MCNVEPDELPRNVRQRASQYISENFVPPPIQVVEVRQVFAGTPICSVEDMGRGDQNHTHGLSATYRSAASQMIDDMGKQLATTPTFYQGSGADVRNGRDISRIYFWPKDLQVPVAAYNPVPDALVALVDVDYYVDLNEFLMDNFMPVVMYTFQPATVAASNGDYAFTFLEDGRVRYQVSGGSGYSHKIWSFTGDSIMVVRKRFGFVVEANAYLIERRHVDTHHQLVALIPLRRFTGFGAWVASRVCGHQALEHLNPNVGGGFLRMETKTPGGLEVHTGKAGLHAACTLPKHVDDRLAVACSSMPKGLTMGAVARIVGSAAPELSLELVQAFYTQCGRPTIAANAVVDPFVRSYQFVEDLSALDVDAQAAMVSYMNPFIDAAFVPALCRANDERAVQKRIKALVSSTVITPFLSSCIDDFLSILLKGAEHSMFPVEEEEVYARQNRPTQRRILEDSQWEDGERLIKSFVKREAYETPTDPRVISTINGRDKREYSAYTYAAADFMKKQPWYAFGKTPREVAERVADICSGAKSVIMTDFSRMDGRVSEVARALEQRFMLGLFHKDERTTILALLKTQFNLSGRTRYGVAYESLLARLSGSPETSVFNTLLNVFCAFVAFRKTPQADGYVSPREAYSRLGIYAGDDGLTADAPPKTYEKAARLVGQFLTAETKLRGEVGVTFLSRHYGPDVWWNEPHSMCVAPRLLSKFHVTVRMQSNVSATDKLWDKAYAAWLTDANTPIIGPFVTKVLELSGKSSDEFKNLAGAWNVAPKDAQYPNDDDSQWMEDHVRNLLPEFTFSSYTKWIESVSSIDELLKMSPWQEKKEAVNKTDSTLHVDETLVGPKQDAKKEEGPQLPGADEEKKDEGWTKVSRKSKKLLAKKTPDSTITKDDPPSEIKSGQAPRTADTQPGKAKAKAKQRGKKPAKKPTTTGQ
jgi:hypothetical protein